MKQDPTKYAEMKNQGARAEAVLRSALADGYKNFECIALVCGVFEMPLHEVREIAHRIYAEKPST